MSRYVGYLCVLLVLVSSCGGTSDLPTDTGTGTGTGGSSNGRSDASVGANGDSSIGGPCTAAGQACSTGAECCTGTCDATTHTCRGTGGGGACVAAGGTCGASADCCSLSCNGGSCAATCVSDKGACTSNAACCSGTCAGGTCQTLNPTCKTLGNTCTANAECCSKLCKNGICAVSSFCSQLGDVCSSGPDCCTGTCNKAAGATVGTCGEQPAGPTYCRGVDGTVCDGCNQCCSRLCVPYGPSGVHVCQRANGCHVNGDLCRKTSDCCGAPGTGLPGAGNVVCDLEPGQTVGICRNPRSCNPEGNVCHYKDYPCSISSARNDCCGAVGNSGACQLDPLGVPRCHGLGTCRKVAETCASSADCCDRVPCVPDPNGVLRCLQGPDGGTCMPAGGSCTINGDCCVGSMCVTAPGSTNGSCVAIPPPPPSDAGTPRTDAGTSDATTPPPPPADGGICALFGQACKSSSDCCNGIPCLGPGGVPCTGTGCLCYDIVPR